MLAPNLLPRSRRQAFTALLFLTLCWLLILHWRRPSTRTIHFDAFNGHLTSSDDISQLCAVHNFPAAISPETKGHKNQRRVYDLFLLSGELDWLEIRLNTLHQHIDYFIIVESDRTSTGRTKPLHLHGHWPKFDTFHRKIIYVPLRDEANSTRTWDDEDGFRNALLYESLPQIAGTRKEPRYGDALMVSNIDEIPRPETVKLLRYCDFPDRLTLRSRFYTYSFQWLHRGEQWAHPQATVYRGLENTISPTDLRNGEGGPHTTLFAPLRRAWQKTDLFDAAWHCSFCFRTIAETQTKMESSLGRPDNTEENRSPRTIVDRMRNGLDLFNREGEVYDKIEGNPDVPSYILQRWQDYRYLLNRDGPGAGFEDAKDLGVNGT